eukprot:CAMPEP_0115837998 /NCGR_PEP_ID=MMETSP0287-20121206/5503_1 /TAXON_ID=412157 /ORGANISM="Chrysochromulina rotalis, Strain UIO044" /LENGTH=53 /DNA_ID=CAMNT_0003291513 /DNA_START=248 /DNA_END=409 /DNA_ORIENTATION=-
MAGARAVARVFVIAGASTIADAFATVEAPREHTALCVSCAVRRVGSPARLSEQ